jgi:membrane associated rhomboid family serine protease
MTLKHRNHYGWHVISYRHLTLIIINQFLLLPITNVNAFSEFKALPTSLSSFSCWHPNRKTDETRSMLHHEYSANLRSNAVLVVLPLSRSSSNTNHKDDGDDDVKDLFQEELEKLQLNLRDELKELTYTIDDLQRRSQRRIKKMSAVTVQNILVSVNVIFFVYQMLTAPRAVRPTKVNNISSAIQRWHTSFTKGNKGFHRAKGATNLFPNVLLSSLTTDFMFMSSLANQGRQPHRYVTSGFLHGGILHLLLNMRSLYRTPTWLEAGLGKPLYMTVYLLSTIGANLCHAYFHGAGAPTIGSSGAICGLMGYEFIMWRKLKRTMNSNYILQNMLAMLLVGALVPCVSNASHIGGFVTGALLGWFLGPSFTKSYAAKRDRLNYSNYASSANLKPPAELQRVMGFDLVMSPPLVPLKIFWGAIIVLCATNPNTRRIPELISKGFFHPGSLSRRLY